jgi:EAL domain-containing protein (putative c-di-GMP-specific phosphodiesterase class I)
MESVGSHIAGLRLRAALEEKQFRLCYQPQIDPRTGRIVGAEALLRWQDPSGQLFGPEHFMPGLESSGMIVPVGAWAFAQASADCRGWRRLGLPRIKIGLNVSPSQLVAAQVEPLIIRIRDLLDSCDVQLEIGGAHVLTAPEWLLRSLHTLRFSGADIAIQDFGLDDSMHRQLWSLPVDALKIHRSFVARISDPEVDDELAGMLMLARAFRLGCVAEGVETEEQFRRLGQLHCERSQGFFHSPAVSSERFEWMLRAGRYARTESRPPAGRLAYDG